MSPSLPTTPAAGSATAGARGARPSDARPGAVAVLDLDLSAKNSEQLDAHGLPPAWRRFWTRLTAAGVPLLFPRLALGREEELLEQFRVEPVEVLVLHVDNYVPDRLGLVLARLAGEGCVGSLIACGYLATEEPAELLARCPVLDGVLPGPLEAVLPELGRCLAERRDPARLPGFLATAEAAETAGEAPRPRLSAADLAEGLEQVASGDLTGQCLKRGVGIIQGSIGCPCRCAFCRSSAYYRDHSRNPYSLRPIGDLVAEIETLYQRCGIRHFKFYDLNFLGTRKLAPRRARELGEALQRLGLALTFELHCRTEAVTAEVLDALVPVGLRHLAIGIESMSPSQLARYEKGETIEDHRRAARLVGDRGLVAQGYTILADPLVRRDELLESLDGLAELNRSVLVLVHERMILYRSTPYFERHRDEIRSPHPMPSSLATVIRYDFSDPWVRRFYPRAEAASQRFKAALAEFQKRRLGPLTGLQLHRFVRAGTALRLELLRRIVGETAPGDDLAETLLAAAVERIPSVVPAEIVPQSTVPSALDPSKEAVS